MLSRRAVITGAASSLLAAPLAGAAFAQSSDDDPYPLPKFDYSKLPEPFRPAVVNYSGRQWPGTIIVDTQARQLYLVLQIACFRHLHALADGGDHILQHAA